MSKLAEHAMEFEEMPLHKPAKAKKGISRPTPKPSKKELKAIMNKEQFKKAKSAHKAEIAKIKAKRAELKADIKRHKLLIKQAKIVYKLTQMKEKNNGK